MAELTDRDHQELCLLYENAAANLEFLKKSQWQVYVFYSAVAAFFIVKDNGIIKEHTIKCLISLLLFIGVIVVEFVQAHFRIDMLNYRKMLKNIYEKFGYPFRVIREGAKGEKKVALNTFEKIFRHGGFVYILVVFSYAMVVFWMEKLKNVDLKIGCLLFALILILIVLLISVYFIPLGMEKFAEYVDKKTKE